MAKHPTKRHSAPKEETAADQQDTALDESPVQEDAKAAPSTATNMRMAYCATEIGTMLRVDDRTTPGYSLIRAADHTVVLGPMASLAQTQAALASVDPSIIYAT